MTNVGSVNGKLQSTALGADGVCYADASGLIQVTTAGTSTQLLTSNGPGLAPTFQNAPASGVSGPGSSTNNGIATWNGAGGTALFSPPTPLVSSGGIMTNSNQPAFLALMTGNSGVNTGDGTSVIVPFNTTTFDHGSNFNTGSNEYVCPVTGLYQYNMNIFFALTGAGTNTYYSMLVLVNGGSAHQIILDNVFNQINLTSGFQWANGSILLNNAASDTVQIQVNVQGNATKNCLIGGGASGSNFSGFLVC